MRNVLRLSYEFTVVSVARILYAYASTFASFVVVVAELLNSNVYTLQYVFHSIFDFIILGEYQLILLVHFA